MEKIITLTDIPAIVANELVSRLTSFKIFTFTGPLGAGKTTIIKELIKQCGITSVVTSPTFAYLNTYQDAEKKYTFHHFDLYRINSLESFIDAGFDEYLHKPNDWVLIEWPEIIAPLLISQNGAPLHCKISLNYIPEDSSKRQIKIIP